MSMRIGTVLRGAREEVCVSLDALAEYLYERNYGGYFHATGRAQLRDFLADLEAGRVWPADRDICPLLRLCVQRLGVVGPAPSMGSGAHMRALLTALLALEESAPGLCLYVLSACPSGIADFGSVAALGESRRSLPVVSARSGSVRAL
jgi:hypothetical protein